MDFLEAIILGLIQGLTEFLPISSSAHLRIFGDLVGWGDPGATFTAITQLGTETAVLIYFWKDITRIIGKWFRSFGGGGGKRSTGVQKGDPDVRLGWLIIIGTVPIVLVGFFLQDTIRTALRSLWIVAIVLIVFGLLLWLADWLGRRTKPIEAMSYRDGILIGLAQMLALRGAMLDMPAGVGLHRHAMQARLERDLRHDMQDRQFRASAGRDHRRVLDVVPASRPARRADQDLANLGPATPHDDDRYRRPLDQLVGGVAQEPAADHPAAPCADHQQVRSICLDLSKDLLNRLAGAHDGSRLRVQTQRGAQLGQQVGQLLLVLARHSASSASASSAPKRAARWEKCEPSTAIRMFIRGAPARSVPGTALPVR